MKQAVEQLIQSALKKLQDQGELTGPIPAFQIEVSKDKQHGDFASNVALVLAKTMRAKPIEIADKIIKSLPESGKIKQVTVAGPGFINFFLAPHALHDTIVDIFNKKEQYGFSQLGQGKKILLEFVSSNPTGPLHVGHGRHGAYGDSLANLLNAAGFIVHREYYINDAGRQMDILATSIWLRYLMLFNESIPFPANGYRGDYVIDMAKQLQEQYQQQFVHTPDEVLHDLPPDEPNGGDKEIYIDAIVNRAKSLLGKHYALIFDLGLNTILNDMREDLAEFNVWFQQWFSERDFVATDAFDKMLANWQKLGYVYEREGALWFRATDFGDDKDRVIVRSNGQRTYFANDAAYHINKFDRGFDQAIDIFGTDHHGYAPRIKAVLKASGIDPERFKTLLVQFVTLYRGTEQVSMSTRGGSFVTLRELRKEVGNDAARFFYVTRKYEQHMDFDLTLAKSQSSDNPVYYVHYAHARICSVVRQCTERGLTYDEKQGLANLSLLTEEHEIQLLTTLSRYPDLIALAATHFEPQIVTNYLRELATAFHGYYNSQQFIVEDSSLRNARLALILATRQVFANGLKLLGVSAPESM